MSDDILKQIDEEVLREGCLEQGSFDDLLSDIAITHTAAPRSSDDYEPLYVELGLPLLTPEIQQPLLTRDEASLSPQDDLARFKKILMQSYKETFSEDRQFVIDHSHLLEGLVKTATNSELALHISFILQCHSWETIKLFKPEKLKWFFTRPDLAETPEQSMAQDAAIKVILKCRYMRALGFLSLEAKEELLIKYLQKASNKRDMKARIQSVFSSRVINQKIKKKIITQLAMDKEEKRDIFISALRDLRSSKRPNTQTLPPPFWLMAISAMLSETLKAKPQSELDGCEAQALFAQEELTRNLLSFPAAIEPPPAKEVIDDHGSRDLTPIAVGTIGTENLGTKTLSTNSSRALFTLPEPSIPIENELMQRDIFPRNEELNALIQAGSHRRQITHPDVPTSPLRQREPPPLREDCHSCAEDGDETRLNSLLIVKAASGRAFNLQQFADNDQERFRNYFEALLEAPFTFEETTILLPWYLIRSDIKDKGKKTRYRNIAMSKVLCYGHKEILKCIEPLGMAILLNIYTTSWRKGPTICQERINQILESFTLSQDYVSEFINELHKKWRTSSLRMILDWTEKTSSEPMLVERKKDIKKQLALLFSNQDRLARDQAPVMQEKEIGAQPLVSSEPPVQRAPASIGFFSPEASREGIAAAPPSKKQAMTH